MKQKELKKEFLEETWIKEFEECFTKQEPNDWRRLKSVRSTGLENFIWRQIEQATLTERARIDGLLDQYFKGLIHIPYPQATLDNIKKLITQSQ